LSIIADSNEALNEIQLKVEEMCSDAGDLDFVRNDVYARFASKSYNKGSALEEVSKTLGVPAGAIFAAGDHWNDLPMLDLRYAGNIACPANAIPAVKKRVKSQEGYQSDEYEGNGTVEAIIHFEPELATILES